MSIQHPGHRNLRVHDDHPLVRVKLTRARDARTSFADFRRTLNEIAGLMVAEVTRDLPTRETEVETPYERTRGHALAGEVTFVPILRAGIGLLDGFLALVPEARVGHVGVYRDESSLEPVPYYAKFPRAMGEGPAIVVDPMLATGGSAAHAISVVKEHGAKAVTLVVLVATPQGVERVRERHGDVVVHAACLDRALSEDGRILPGLGDAGDRLFGTV